MMMMHVLAMLRLFLVPSPCFPHPHQEGGLIYTRLQKKGKGRAIDAEDIDAANHSDHDTQLPNLKKPGNLSTAALDEIHAFAKDVKMMVEELGQWHGQSTCNTLITVGFSVKASHTKINEANLFHLWYWATQPKPDGARVDNEKTQFSGWAEAWSNLKNIKIVGAVMYVGQDPAGRQTSGIFGGSKMIRNFINENGIDVWSLMDKHTAIFKFLRNGDGVDARVAGTSSIGDETLRDCNHRVFRCMMKEKMLATLRDLCVTHGIEVSDPQKVSWHQLLRFLRKSHLTIFNWPHSVSPPGPGFEYKKLKAGPLHQLVVPYLQRKLGLLYDGQTNDEEEQDSLDDVLEIEIKCWNEEVIDILDADPLKGEIVLIKATNGTVLQQISDDPEWQKSLKETDHQQQGTEQQLPFPSWKRPHVEVSNHNTIGPQDVCPIAQDLCHDPSTIPSNVHTREPGPSKPPTLALQYGVGIYIRIIFQAILTCERLAQPSSLFPDDNFVSVAPAITVTFQDWPLINSLLGVVQGQITHGADVHHMSIAVRHYSESGELDASVHLSKPIVVFYTSIVQQAFNAFWAVESPLLPDVHCTLCCCDLKFYT
ncbi:hypothetical protein F5J12DRAFT_784502 [Pisolithus orientalis]|uniref:uncharacterized protein n=1 Tax=Pisolithus orientalis TaxID=936130 RepID=UPI0022247D53|nr:uncharacterized protein F5J12DRAFT_784502 [Pisolithus orientalis]KAI6000198.1 hypothetical protein F5J12DRAFT_784502 [Pisolithus orientalis]